MPTIVIIDTLYDAFIRSLPFDPHSTYEVELRKVLDRQFGTADFYSKNLRALGWDAVDVIANHAQLQEMWCRENSVFSLHVHAKQIAAIRPDIVFLQDLSLMNSIGAVAATYGIKIAAQCSCPWPGDSVIARCSVVFTSFPHFVPRIEKLGVRAVYNPLAFEPSVLERMGPNAFLTTERALTDEEMSRIKSAWEAGLLNTEQQRVNIIKGGLKYSEARPRQYDCVFIGGVGAPSHWKRGMETLETVAREIPTFKWWGYGVDTLPANSALRGKYQGQAWGRDMYEILLRSKICLNRHGEVAEGFANNMRMYEATGCGALLVTDNDTDLFADDEIVRYSSPQDAVDKIRYYLAHEDERAAIAAKGQKRTLTDHTYAKRMQVVSDALKEMLVTA